MPSSTAPPWLPGAPLVGKLKPLGVARCVLASIRLDHGYLGPGVPDFPRWGEAAPFVALSERLYSKTCTLASDIDDFEPPSAIPR